MKNALFAITCSMALLAATLISCGNEQSHSTETLQPNKVVASTNENAETNTATPDAFPENVEILLPTQYRKESVGYPKNVKEKEWYELCQNKKNGKWQIGKAQLNITYGRDECVGEDVMILSSQHDNAVMFFTAFVGMDTAISTFVSEKTLFPGQEVTVPFNGTTYRLTASGKINDEEGRTLSDAEIQTTDNDALAVSRISNYQLQFSTTGKVSYKIASLNEIESATPKLVWAGDVNQDGLPDMVLSLPDFYESQHILFFLSDKNDTNKPLKKVAEITVTNDC